MDNKNSQQSSHNLYHPPANTRTGSRKSSLDESDEWIKLNVGGQIFTTTRTTLCNNEPNSMLARMFHHHHLHNRNRHTQQQSDYGRLTRNNNSISYNNSTCSASQRDISTSTATTDNSRLGANDDTTNNESSTRDPSPTKTTNTNSTSTTAQIDETKHTIRDDKNNNIECPTNKSARDNNDSLTNFQHLDDIDQQQQLEKQRKQYIENGGEQELGFDYLDAISSSFSLRPSPRDSNGAYLIDRSPKYFEPILNYLRHGKLIIDHDVNVQGVLEEAKFFGIVSLLPMLELETERLFRKKHQKLRQSLLMYDNNCDGLSNDAVGGLDGTQLQTMPPLTRQDVIKALITTSATTPELRFQGANLAGANLSRLDLRYINFKFANLRNSNLKGANLSYSNLERADLYQSNLEGAQLTGANLAHSNLENSNLRAITILPKTINDKITSFEGANMININLEGSQLAKVNMRVAILKGSNLQNCDLAGAFLAGADLENCDFSGSDLNEANLRGANIKGASFEIEVL